MSPSTSFPSHHLFLEGDTPAVGRVEPKPLLKQVEDEQTIEAVVKQVRVSLLSLEFGRGEGVIPGCLVFV